MATDSVEDAEYASAIAEANQEIREKLQPDIDNPKVWVNKNGFVRRWAQLDFEHLEFIIMGLRSGKDYAGQGWKIKQAEKELLRRLDSNN